MVVGMVFVLDLCGNSLRKGYHAAYYGRVNSVFHRPCVVILAVAILHFWLVWFGLRNGQPWSLWALTSANLVIIIFFLLAARDFSVRLAPLQLSDLAPYALLPAIILPFAAVLGWIGLH
jgi:hypothetical protein